jgi:aminoglycoside phosphotransferase (APT) family kinase protein
MPNEMTGRTTQVAVHEVSADATLRLPGLDLKAVSGWFADALDDGSGPISARLIAGGKSNLTYEISNGTRNLVLRRPPIGKALATAHDITREFRVMSALAQTDVPVPDVLAFCADANVIGSPFYIMEMVDGAVFRRADDLRSRGPQRTGAVSTGLVDALVALHQVDPAAVGLDAFGRTEGFLERQTRRWTKQLELSSRRVLPAAEELRGRLVSEVPAQFIPGIVHGDYRLDNVLIDDHDRPAAIIDWEMATLGDPLTDLALLVMYHRLAQIPGGELISDVAAAPGYIAETQVRQRYLDHSGRDTPHFGFYLGLAAYKLAAIVEGVHHRHSVGQTVGEGFEGVEVLTEPLLEIGLTAMREET